MRFFQPLLRGRNSSTVFLCLLLLWTGSLGAQVLGADDLPIEGTLQLWERACTAPDRCGLPTPTSDPHTVATSVASPTPGHGTYADARWESGPFLVKIGIFQKAVDPASPYSFTSWQVSLHDAATGRLYAECSGFEPLQTSLYFPVGACSGEAPGSQGLKRVGVTFKRK